MVSEVTDKNFQTEVMESEVPVLVDFWAEWCGPCRALAPVLEDLASKMNGKVKIVKINIDGNQEIPTQYAIRSIPTLMLFKDGKLVETKVGALAKEALAAWLKGCVS
jgi:thioredoxin 1